MRTTTLALSLFALMVTTVNGQGQGLRERNPALASSPAAAAYDLAAAAPAPATTADVAGPGFYAASPASGGAPPQLLMEKGKLGTGEPAADSVYNIIKAQGASGKDFSVLATLIDKAGLAGALADPNAAVTVFAPTDAAFRKFAEASGKKVSDLENDPSGVVKAILLQHVATESKPLAALYPGESLPTKGTAGLRVDAVAPARVSVIGGGGGESTAETGVSTLNKKGHVISISRVLLPPSGAVEGAV